MFRQLRKWAVVALAALLVVGCSNKGSIHRTGPGMDGEAVSTGVADGAYWGEDLSGMSQEELLQRQVFYFDLDGSSINPNYMPAIEAHGRYLASNPNAKVRVEGHTDERGSSEYNIALGERRAQAVERALIVNGAQAGQVVVVSYGKEKPAVQGHDEAAWKYNRRAVIVYEVN